MKNNDLDLIIINRDSLLKKLSKLLLKLIKIYNETNKIIVGFLPTFILKLFGLKEDNRFLKLFQNEYIAIFISTISLYFVANLVITPPIIKMALPYLAGMNIIVICCKILGWDKKAEEKLK
tara:strand:- start:12319 stop:12681 length:363 start_codon:yes stop_codon:yes gene_type:complete